MSKKSKVHSYMYVGLQMWCCFNTRRFC